MLVVGFWLVLQQMPRAVTEELPMEVTLPTPLAVVVVMSVTSTVVTAGREEDELPLAETDTR